MPTVYLWLFLSRKSYLLALNFLDSFNKTLNDNLLEYCKTPYLNSLTATIIANPALINRIKHPISASAIDKLPTAFLSSNGIGAVKGKKLKNFTIGDSGVEMNKVTA